ncbi:TetR/AcrR family transcriptional regulator [Roseomonas sp. CCTCC AB2023176]|uniref:TetR/AcrR family transcriptional regulator n=1 Tax=Roseomonas sp. CCTCC AB2023176 TaxID=3342640 RepID=UPI0035DCDECC
MSVAVTASVVESSPKRAAILDAAAELFLAQGYASVSMDAVAKAAAVSKATLYAYFSGKDALFGAIVAERCAAITAEAEALLSADALPEQALRQAARVWLKFLLSPHTLAIYRTVVAEGPRFPDLARTFQAAGPSTGRAWLTRLLREEQRLGLLRADMDPEAAAGQLGALMRGDLHLRAMLGAVPPSDEEVAAAADAAVAMFIRAYGVPREP